MSVLVPRPRARRVPPATRTHGAQVASAEDRMHAIRAKLALELNHVEARRGKPGFGDALEDVAATMVILAEEVGDAEPETLLRVARALVVATEPRKG